MGSVPRRPTPICGCFPEFSTGTHCI